MYHHAWLMHPAHTDTHPLARRHFSCSHASFHDLLFPSLRGRMRQESPTRWPNHGVCFPQIWATRPAVGSRGAGASIYGSDIFMFGSSHVFLHTHVQHSSLIMTEVTRGTLRAVFGRWFLRPQKLMIKGSSSVAYTETYIEQNILWYTARWIYLDVTTWGRTNILWDFSVSPAFWSLK